MSTNTDQLLIPQGVYACAVVEYAKRESPRRGIPYIWVKLRIEEGEFAGRFIFLTVASTNFAYVLLKSCGIGKASPEDQAEDMVRKCMNLRLPVRMNHREFQGRIYPDPKIGRYAEEAERGFV